MGIIELIGDNSVELTQIISIVILFYIHPYFIIFYVVGFFVNTWINRVLKKIFYKSIPPSGHFQKNAYSIAFIGFTLYYTHALSLYWKYIIGAYAFVTMSCFYNCIVYKYHTISEMIVGSGIGGLIGYILFQLSQTISNLQGYK
jgi:hypothetical protein